MGLGAAHVSTGHHGHSGGFRHGHGPARQALLVSIEVPRDIDPEPFPAVAENALGPVEGFGLEASVTAHEQGEVSGVFFELVPIDSARVLLAPLMAYGEESGESSPASG